MTTVVEEPTPAVRSTTTLLGDDSVGGPSRTPSELATGDIVGRYVVLSRIGAGGMGVVYAAYDPELDRKVALKLLERSSRADASSDTRSASRLREAQALARLNHPNVVAVYDVGDLDGRVWLAMEFVAGRTFADWMREQPRSWREVLDVLRPVAVGLAAAHAAGLVHRDVKPDNVMLGDDEGGARVRLMDFGLARTAARGEVATAEHGGDLHTSARAGTPGYMAPEQWMGLPADARTDQFAFCVMAWESMFTQRAFAGETVAELVASVLAGTLRPPPRGSSVPGWLRRAVRRGLEREPGARHASMPALLDAIDRGRGRARLRGISIGVAGILAVAAAGFGVHAARRSTRIAACTDQGAAIEAVWNTETRATVHAALAAAPVSYAATSADKAMPWFDAHAEAWRRTATDVCVAAEVEHTLGAELHQRATWCLEDRRAELQTLLEVLGEGGAKAAERAVSIGASLPPVPPCGDAGALSRMPAIPDRTEGVLEARRALLRAGAKGAAGSYAQAIALAEPLLVQAKALAWPPLVAAVQIKIGRWLDATGKFAEAEVQLGEAYFTAAAADDLALAAEAADDLAFTVGVRLERHDDGLTWSRHAALARARQQDDAGLFEARHLATLANIHAARGDHAQAQALHEQALEIRERVLGPRHPDTAGSLNNLANAVFRSGDVARAAELYERGCAVLEESLGADHPSVATCLVNVASVAAANGSRDRAEQLYERALVVLESSLGADHPSVASTLVNLAHLKVTGKQLDAAETMYTRALAIWEAKLGPTHPLLTHPLLGLTEVMLQRSRPRDAVAFAERAAALHTTDRSQPQLAAESQFELAKAMWAAEGDRPRARTLAEQARAYQVEQGAAGAARLAEIDAWLQAHVLAQ